VGGLALGGRLRAARDRVVTAGWPVLQSSVAAGLAWFVSTALLGYEQPFYAAVAAVVCLGVTTGQRPRRAAELAVGVAVGIFVADLLVLALGTGVVQLVLVTALAMLLAVALGGGTLLVNQAAISAILVVTIAPPTDGLVLDRFVHALVGGAVGLLVGQVLFPVDAEGRVARLARPVFRDLGAVLTSVANALGSGDLERAERALASARALDPAVRALHEALVGARETARVAPLRRGVRGLLEEQADSAVQLDLAVRNTRVLARASVALLRRRRSVAPELSAAVGELAYAVQALGEGFEHPERAEDVRRLATAAAVRATSLLEDLSALWTAVLVGHVRATAVDLLRGSGLDLQEAIAAVDPDGA